MNDNTPAPTNSARTWSMLCHLSALAGFIVPFGFILGPLIIWLIKRDEFPLVDANGKEALNFQLSFTIYAIVAGILTMVFIGLFLLFLVAAVDVILTLVATVKTSNGESFRYPLTIRFLK